MILVMAEIIILRKLMMIQMNKMEVMMKVPRKKKATVIKSCPCKKMIIVKMKELL